MPTSSRRLRPSRWAHLLALAPYGIYPSDIFTPWGTYPSNTLDTSKLLSLSILLAPRISFSLFTLGTSDHILLWFPLYLRSHIPLVPLSPRVTYPFNTLGISGHISLQYSWHLGSQGPFNTLGTSEYLSSLYPALNFRAPSARRHHLAQPEDPQ